MDRADFWRLIEESKRESGGGCERQVGRLQEKLTKLPGKEIISFSRILCELLNESYTWELWAAGYIINGGCGDDGFDYFRGWLVAQGESIFMNALEDPETLADFPDEFPDYARCEELTDVADEVYEEKTGRELPDRAYVFPESTEPKGKRWKEEEVETVLPRLAERVRDKFRWLQ
jgi:hypothetical protein